MTKPIVIIENGMYREKEVVTLKSDTYVSQKSFAKDKGPIERILTLIY
ncbi:MAG: hypothetical protein Kow00127_23190 [Bacteroidales bacterium]